jgi:hypothetical protein
MVNRTAWLLPLALMACAHAPPTSEPSSPNPLVGTWQLERVVAIRTNGEETVSFFGKNPSGFITYTRDGHMAAQIMGDPRPKIGDPQKLTPDECKAMVESYLAYAGTYDYDPVTRVVTHHARMSIDPSEIGHDMLRKVELDGDRVTLTTTPYTLRGEKLVNKLAWQRLR